VRLEGLVADQVLAAELEHGHAPPDGVYRAGRRGEELRARDMCLMHDCLQLDTWPSYPPVVTPLSLPAYAFKDAA
jgi:hypothetical protein